MVLKNQFFKGRFSITENINANYLHKNFAFWKVYTDVYNHT